MRPGSREAGTAGPCRRFVPALGPGLPRARRLSAGRARVGGRCPGKQVRARPSRGRSGSGRAAPAAPGSRTRAGIGAPGVSCCPFGARPGSSPGSRAAPSYTTPDGKFGAGLDRGRCCGIGFPCRPPPALPFRWRKKGCWPGKPGPPRPESCRRLQRAARGGRGCRARSAWISNPATPWLPDHSALGKLGEGLATQASPQSTPRGLVGAGVTVSRRERVGGTSGGEGSPVLRPAHAGVPSRQRASESRARHAPGSAALFAFKSRAGGGENRGIQNGVMAGTLCFGGSWFPVSVSLPGLRWGAGAVEISSDSLPRPGSPGRSRRVGGVR